jgi:hypothetical protein
VVKDRVYDVIQRAGGLTSVTNVEGNFCSSRPYTSKQIEDLENVNLNLGKKDSIQNKLEKKIKRRFEIYHYSYGLEAVVRILKILNVTLFPEMK